MSSLTSSKPLRWVISVLVVAAVLGGGLAIANAVTDDDEPRAVPTTVTANTTTTAILTTTVTAKPSTFSDEVRYFYEVYGEFGMSPTLQGRYLDPTLIAEMQKQRDKGLDHDLVTCTQNTFQRVTVDPATTSGSTVTAKVHTFLNTNDKEGVTIMVSGNASNNLITKIDCG